MRILLCMALALGFGSAWSKETVTVGSKPFTEAFLLGEIISQIIEDTGEARVDRKFGLGETGIVWQALLEDRVQVYPEYTGTISEALLKDPNLKTVEQIRKALAASGLTVSESLGFNNTYALAMKAQQAKELGIESIGDLVKRTDLKLGFSAGFLSREDCFPKLEALYGLKRKYVRSLQHGLAYEALASGKIDVIDIYSTDAKIAKFDLKVLADPKRAFPEYFAVLVARKDFIEQYPKTWRALTALEGKLNEVQIMKLNSQVELEKKSIQEVASTYLGTDREVISQIWSELWMLTRQHLLLVLFAVLAATLLGVPAGILATRHKGLGQFILATSGLVQTIPSLALLCFLIPLFGVGTLPALVALFLYALLPIVGNTYMGLTDLDPKLLEVGKALGLSEWNQLRLIRMPMASRAVMSGIKISAIVSVGTATLAALIGAGGYGDPIVTGLSLNDVPTILKGAIPAALLALVVHGTFEGLQKVVVPKGLQ